MRKIKCFILLLSLLFAFACREEFLFQSSNYQPTLVVDGFITNEKTPYIIKVSYSSPMNNTILNPVEGCEVSLIENSNNIVVLNESEPGVYKSSPDNIQGRIGSTYSIHIETPEGEIYETVPQLMNEPVEIDTAYANFIYLEDENYVFGLPGYKFSVSTKIDPNDDGYFLWNMTETYQYHADYTLFGMYNRNGEFLEVGKDTSDIFNDVYWCWKTKNTGYIVTGTTANLSTHQISKQPILFVGTNSRKLQKRYSLLIEQYTINKDAYLFWNNIEKQSSNKNFLIVNQPFKIIGNLKNINNPDEPVYGYFTVASIDQKRIYVDRPNEAFYYDICLVSYNYEEPVSNFWVISREGRLGTTYIECLDCTSKGGDIIKPDFWINK